MEVDDNETVATGAMVTAVCWVSRGHAKPLLDSHELDEKEAQQQAKDVKKMTK